MSHWVTATIAQVSQASGIPLHLSLGQTDLHSTNYLKSWLEENQVRSSVEMAMMSSPGVVLDLVWTLRGGGSGRGRVNPGTSALPNISSPVSRPGSPLSGDSIKLMTFKLQHPTHIQLQRYIKISIFSSESGTDKQISDLATHLTSLILKHTWGFHPS